MSVIIKFFNGWYALNVLNVSKRAIGPPTDKRQCAPRFVIRPLNQMTYEGQSVKFSCRIISLSTPTVTWYHNNQDLKQSVKYMKRYVA